MKKENRPGPLIDTAHIDKLDASQIMASHRGSRHPGVRQAAIKSAIWMCEECQSIDPAPIQWEKGKLEVNRNWQRLVMDITHYSTHHT